MIYRTFGDLKIQVEGELDLEGEEFCSEAEIRNYFNSACSIMEATIVKLGLREKYFQTDAFTTLRQGQPEYALPSDILINKIRKIVYRNQSTIYTLAPLRGEEAYAFEDQQQNAFGEPEYFSLYKTGLTQMIRVTPIPRYDVEKGLRIVYFKSVNRYVDDQTLCDLPDICYEYVMSYVRYKVYSKESHSNTQDEKQNMQALLGLVQETMQNQIADPDIDQIDMDFSHYEEMN